MTQDLQRPTDSPPPPREAGRLAWRVLSAACAALIVAAFAFEGFAVYVQRSEGSAALSSNVGNFPRVRESLTRQPPREEFSFAVIGDTRGSTTFEKIAAQLRDEPLAFCAVLGDFVSYPSPQQHAFFRGECEEELALPFPVFLVPGNHDVRETSFPVARFEETYGPTIFSFVYQDCLFVFLRMLPRPYSNRESLDFLRKLADGAVRDQYARVFVLTHAPPPISTDFEYKKCDGSDEFVSLIDRLKPDYVICGDYHGYARVTVRGVPYLITGGGGAPLVPSKFGHFHHAIVIHVKPDSVSERVLFANAEYESEDRFEKFILVGFYPWLQEHRAATFAANVLLLVALAASLRWAIPSLSTTTRGKGGRSLGPSERGALSEREKKDR